MTGSSAESAAFLEFHRNPSSDSLLEALRAYQGRIYRMCFQVLRDAHDAEDAAQVVLLKIVDEVRKFDDPNSFQRWLNRVSLNAALESARKAGRRRTHETRAAMEKPVPAPIDAAGRLALFEAIASLDEGPRNLVLEHYFEGESLESIAEREGLSPSGVCRQLESARESMRRILGGAMAVAALPSLDRLFPATPPPPDLVSGAVVAKVHSVAAALAAGGIAMTSKSTIAAAIAIVAAVCLSGGAGLGYVVKSRSESGHVRGLETRLAVAEKEAMTLRQNLARNAALPQPGEIAKVPDATKETGSPLASRLARYKAWKKRWDAEWAASQERFKTDDAFFQEMAIRRDRERKEQFKGMRELACQEPQTFLDFLKEHQDYVILNEVAEYSLIFEFMGTTGVQGQQFHVFPKELTEGLLDLLKTGSTVQKVVMLELFGRMSSPPKDYCDAYLAFLDEADPSIQRSAVSCVSKVIPMTQEIVQKFSAIGHPGADRHTRWAVMEAMTYVRYPEAEGYLLECLETFKDGTDVDVTAARLSSWYMTAATYAIPISEDRYLTAAVAALGRSPSVNGQQAIARGALYLSPARTKEVIKQVMSASRDADLRDKLSRILAKLDQGQTRRDDLIQILHGFK